MVGAVIVIYLAYKCGKVQFDFAVFFLALGLVVGIYYGFYFIGNSDTVDVSKILSPVVAYLLGVLLVNTFETYEKSVKLVYASMSIPMAVYALSSAIYCVMNTREGTILGNIIDNPDLMNRRLVEVMFFMITASLIWAVMTFKNNKFVSCLIIIANVLVQIASIRIHTRYNTYFFVLEIFALLIIWTYTVIKTKCNTIISTIVTIVLSVMLILILTMVYRVNLGGLRNIYYNSFWGADGGILHSYKYQNIGEAVRNLFTENNRKGFYINANGINTSYNLWLDYARDYGMYSFGLIYIFKILTVIYTFRMIINKNVSSEIKYLLVPAFLAFNIFYSTEAISKVQIYTWIWGLIISGMIRTCCLQKKVKE
ncbi:hypothetical protein [Pseudobutyrivibrio ruminis]|uniref:hypothetical protein n=1 Tax=Pseudobutyrivibrio ruminis TaxID=46206 RepID=UPI0012DEDCEC|nr:hypothetical protein [Pseudobutyrivibrio ruminis]